MEEIKMATKKKVFSKAQWLEFANKQKEQGILSQREIDDACVSFANEFDGKTEEEIKAIAGENHGLREEYFVEV